MAFAVPIDIARKQPCIDVDVDVEAAAAARRTCQERLTRGPADTSARQSRMPSPDALSLSATAGPALRPRLT